MTVPVFAFAAVLDFAAEEIAHQLHAIADAQHRNAEFEDLGIRMRRVFGVNAFRSPGEDDADDTVSFQLSRRRGEVVDFRVYLALTDSACDDLGKLGAEVEDG